jgi:hypothetical protein
MNQTFDTEKVKETVRLLYSLQKMKKNQMLYALPDVVLNGGLVPYGSRCKK